MKIPNGIVFPQNYFSSSLSNPIKSEQLVVKELIAANLYSYENQSTPAVIFYGSAFFPHFRRHSFWTNNN